MTSVRYNGSAPATVVELLGTRRVVVMEIALSEGAEVIDRQLLELSTPVIKLWDRVVAVPLIGTLDSARTQVMTETLLQAIVDQDAAVAILDITEKLGVTVVGAV
ncbi:MAG: sle [Actinoallomurus sp.]|nr:sle [Actinoallomurus sp.]